MAEVGEFSSTSGVHGQCTSTESKHSVREQNTPPGKRRCIRDEDIISPTLSLEQDSVEAGVDKSIDSTTDSEDESGSAKERESSSTENSEEYETESEESEEEWTPLHLAAQEGHLDAVQFLLEIGACLNFQTDNGVTPLHLAAQNGHHDTVQHLVGVGADLNIQDDRGATPLHGAAHNGHLHTVQHLVERGADLNIKTVHGTTPLHLAAHHGQLHTVQHLVTTGADLNIKAVDGWTPLHVAAQEGHLDTVQFLVERGAYLNIQTDNGTTPLHLAAHHGQLHTVQHLVRAGADLNIKAVDGLTPLHVAAQEGHLDTVQFLVERGAYLNIQTDNGRTPLHLVAHNGHLDTVQHLVTAGADMNIKTVEGWTPLHLSTQNGHLDIIQHLFVAGADLNIITDHGATPLHLASQDGHVDTVQHLIGLKADLDIKDHNGNTSLHLAVYNGHLDTVQHLVRAGADLNITTVAGATPLHLASQNGHVDTVQHLIGLKADLNIKDDNGNTSLHLAVYNGRLDTVQHLVRAGADLNIKDDDGTTPLHLAAHHGQLHTVQHLVRAGADLNIKDDDGWTPLHLAAHDGYLDTVKYLVRRGAHLNIKTVDGMTPLDLAASHGHKRVVAHLKRVADPNMLEESKSTEQQRKQRQSSEGTVPAAPTILSVKATSSTSISVCWTASKTDGGTPTTGYVVEYHHTTNPVFETQVVPRDVFSTILGGLKPSTKYEVRVRGENAAGRSDASATMQAKTKVDVKQTYEREMRYGHIATSIAKVLLFGIAGSGKTSATAIMMGEDPPSVYSSTPLMVRPVHVITVLIEELTKWEKKSPEEVRKIIAEIIRSRESYSESQELQRTYSESRELPPTYSESRESRQTYSESRELRQTYSESQQKGSKSQRTYQPKRPLLKQVQQKEGQPLFLTLPKPKSEFDSVLESAIKEVDFLPLVQNCNPPSKPILKQRWLYITDSGGQPEFHNMLSIFVQNTTACIFVFKMHEELDDCPRVAYYTNGNSLGPTCNSRMTNRQIFEQFIRTMRSFNSMKNEDTSLSIILLATHRDLVDVSKLPELLEERHKQLKAIVLPQFRDQLIYCNNQLEKFIFTMNAKHPEGRDRDTANEIRRVITEECPGREMKIPLRWHRLDHLARKIPDDLGRKVKVLSRDEYGKIARKLSIDDDSCEGALEFFNSLNTISYFPKVLPDLVFLEPQILLDLLTKFVEKKYLPEQHNPVHAIKPKKCTFPFHDFAQVTEEFLNNFKEHYHPPLFTSKKLAQLFEGLLIFGKLEDGVWFVPSILPFMKEEEVEQHRISKERALVINFPNGGPQNGIFCSTVSFLLSTDNTSPSNWKVLKDSCGKPKCLKRNVISFTLSSISGKVTLIEEWTHFEVHVKTSACSEGRLWKLVYKAVFDGLKKAAETHHYTCTGDIGPHPAIICPEQHTPTLHPATIDCKEGTWMWRCTESQEFGDQVPSQTIPWLSFVPPQITQQPADQLDVVTGSPVKFTLIATTDFGTLTYQWQRNGTDLDPLPEGVSGETTCTLQLDSVKKSHEGIYRCIVSNELGATPLNPVSNTTSNPAQLTVLDSPQIIQHPTPNLDVVAGSPVKFTVTATGGGALMYKWQQDGAEINPPPEGVSGETTSTLQIDSVKKNHEGTYTCIVSNLAGTTPSKPAQLTVSVSGTQPQLVQQNLPQIQLAGASQQHTSLQFSQQVTELIEKQQEGRQSPRETDTVHSGATRPPSPKRPKICLSENTTIDDQIDRPTLIACIKFRGRRRKINIPQEIGVRYRDFGLFLLKDENRQRVNAIAHMYQNEAEEINKEILEQWITGKGKHPVTWKTLTEVLRDIELTTLAEEIELAIEH